MYDSSEINRKNNDVQIKKFEGNQNIIYTKNVELRNTGRERHDAENRLKRDKLGTRKAEKSDNI